MKINRHSEELPSIYDMVVSITALKRRFFEKYDLDFYIHYSQEKTLYACDERANTFLKFSNHLKQLRIILKVNENFIYNHRDFPIVAAGYGIKLCPSVIKEDPYLLLDLNNFMNNSDHNMENIQKFFNISLQSKK